ncbi:MAG: lysophospholipid acyltransferase family protein [Synergistaceae bacterium]|jgi:KDO2-lipid IV(A) lauroyltransferase|nr:lysophospholipid acyltransferase family protein [Synergistaceae bacterium]
MAQPVIWASLVVFRSLCCALPHERALSLGGFLGHTVERFSSKRVQRARARCERMLGVDAAEASRIISGVYSHFGMSLVEFLRLPKMIGHIEELVEVEGYEHFERAMDKGRGAIFLSAHIGNWEYGAALLASRGIPMNAIGAEQRDSRITKAIADLRRSAGVKPLAKGLGLKGAFSCLRAGETLAVLLDQNAKDAGVISPFLGFPASTPTGPIKLARKFGSPVLPARVIRRPDGERFLMTIDPPLEGPDGSPFVEDIQYAADRCNEAISSWIKETPEQWLWTYPRWESTLGDR